MKTLLARFQSVCSRQMCLATVLVAALSGCDGKDVKVYKLAKDPSAAKPQGDMSRLPMAAGGAPSPSQLKWTLPEGWTEVPPGEMRTASFIVKGLNGKQADVSVIPLPGGAGGDANNVNRWRGQVGLATVSAEELAKAAMKIEVAGQPAELHDAAGTNSSSGDPARILGVIQHRDGMAWFFKMTGDDELVAGQKAAFIEFLKSVKFEAGERAALPPSHPPLESAGLPAGHPPIENPGLPAGHPEVSGAPAVAPAVPSSDGKPKWEVPAGWKEIPGGQFLAAKFTLTGEGGAQAAVNVSSSAGDGGGLAGNVNRWRGQLGLSPFSTDELNKSVKTVAANGAKISFVEMSGTDARTGQPSSLVGAMVPHGGQTWFYKLMGDAKVVEVQKAAFTTFVQTVKY